MSKLEPVGATHASPLQLKDLVINSKQILRDPRSLWAAFFLSGLSGLIYETVWVRMITRFLGSTTSATATVLAVFMAGLALGSLIGGRLADGLGRPLKAYALIEWVIALTAALSSFLLISGFGLTYVSWFEWLGRNQPLALAGRVLYAAVCLLGPTILMGATLPLLVAYVTKDQAYQSGLSRLYAINTGGAVLGVLLAGFLFLGELGETGSLLVAMTLNLAAGLMVWSSSQATPVTTDPRSTSPVTRPPEAELIVYAPRIRGLAMFALFWSGFSALGYEIFWTRLLIMTLQTSIYAFSVMLGLVLLGIAAGSWLSGRLVLARQRPLAAFGLSEVLIGVLTVAGLIAYALIGRWTSGFRAGYPLNLLTAAIMIWPPAVIFGWQFPIALRCCISDPLSLGRETGFRYALNALGTIFGSLAAGFVLVPILGTTTAVLLLSIINVLVGFLLFAVASGEERGRLPGFSLAVAGLMAVMMAMTGDPYRAVLGQKIEAEMGKEAVIMDIDDGIAGMTAPAGLPPAKMQRGLYINGINMTALVSEAKIMAHLPLVLVPSPQKLLAVCFGMGTTVRSAVNFQPSLKQIDAVDIIPSVFDFSRYFHDDARDILARPNVHPYVADGRNYLLLTRERYDVITIDPPPPIFSAGTVNLINREFFELCKARITEQGVVCLWLPPAPMTELPMIMKTFLKVFPGASLWSGYKYAGFFLLGGNRDMGQSAESLTQVAERLSRIPDLSEWDEALSRPETIKGLYLCGADELEALTQPFRQVTDDHPYTEFPLWRGALIGSGQFLNSRMLRRVLSEMRAQKSAGSLR